MSEDCEDHRVMDLLQAAVADEHKEIDAIFRHPILTPSSSASPTSGINNPTCPESLNP